MEKKLLLSITMGQMKIINNLLLMCVELFSKSLIIIWVIYLTATKTNLFNNLLLRILIPIILMLWMAIPSVIEFQRRKIQYLI